MILIEKKYQQINLILKKNKINSKIKNNFYSFFFFKILINKNIKIKNFIQINFKNKKKKIFFFPLFFILNNIKIKKNFFIFISNIYIY
ncbi:hypothetical protein CUN91_00980 [Candidatus Carsonella ruddii]|uniref:Uncharacterized protein n=1 Tax=Carsonella ruddii TaxID=114186 RepID=A0A2K8K4M5_CARRU|nr:hypothetical protein [Candidatus Carsonella ruddii]ATX33517.1 hypothetical protein CUN91_00980 [Candidatus Carsonella ruddii]